MCAIVYTSQKVAMSYYQCVCEWACACVCVLVHKSELLYFIIINVCQGIQITLTDINFVISREKIDVFHFIYINEQTRTHTQKYDTFISIFSIIQQLHDLSSTFYSILGYWRTPIIKKCTWSLISWAFSLSISTSTLGSCSCASSNSCNASFLAAVALANEELAMFLVLWYKRFAWSTLRDRNTDYK